MPKRGANVSLSSYDEIFFTEETRSQDNLEKIQNLPLAELHPFQNHPFKVVDDEAMQRTVESVARYGVLAPAIARPRPEGGYEIISGHLRLHAAALAGLKTIPVIVRNMDDDAAVIAMVDANLQRETILPCERAFAYKMKLEAMKHQGQRLKKLSQEGTLNRDTMRTIMSEIKKPELGNITLKDATLRKYFPRSYTPRQMQETIIKLLEQWQKRRQRDMER